MAKLLAMIFVFFVGLTRLPAQSANSTTTQEGAVLTKLFQPVYPPLARQAHIVGDVELLLEVRVNGSVESVDVVSGHPLPKQAAVDSAKQSRFECQRCGEGTLPYHLVYSFQLVAENCCTAPTGVLSQWTWSADIRGSRSKVQWVQDSGEILPLFFQSGHLIVS